ncbi:3-isopropylmalate dehydratase large subunit [Candidatus Methylacidithermus pantelleriae]|uniref:3-isopropylmalate dehydratase large subunit 1 n=1 Tax=Candidatus Methylacidithermus pantelleriae TaxID=2744239 RepID=A0A8J2BJ91_9BACT|nr:aconitase family protein [Candidatus Methylacidithermus pantelleriae]CAF0691867.1 3-isopropylmalate dehydratase large subunit 1 [Candidatus Methylacidithermus pantelleriae]
MTLTEKILARASGKRQVRAGESVWIRVDYLFTHDVCGPPTIGIFYREFGKGARVWDPKRVILIPDHFVFTADSTCHRNLDILRQFARQQGIQYFYDVVDDSEARWAFDPSLGPYRRQYGSRYAGVCHTALPEKGHVRPGEVLLGTDSHTCTAGAFNLFATGIGNTDAAFVLGTGRILVKVPPTLRFYLEGELGFGVMAKDLILHVIGEIGFDGATYCAMQWEGPGVTSLSIEDRMTIANMAIEAGAKNAIFPADAKTLAFVEEKVRQNGTPKDYEPVEPDPEQEVLSEWRMDLSRIEPTVAAPPNPGNRVPAHRLHHVRIDRAYIGSCTGGKVSDFLAFAEVVKGRKVRVETFGVPATPEVVRELKQRSLGEQTVWEILQSAGVQLTENASCAACLGGPADTFGRLNRPMVCISTTNRNFPGRMGHKESQVYLASPYTVAASALEGRIVDPREYLPTG